MTKPGFSAEAVVETPPNHLAEIESRSTTIDSIRYETTKIGDYAPTEIPKLPVGLFVKQEDGTVTRFVDFTVRAGVNTGDFDLFLAELDPQEGENPKKTIETVTAFLGGGRTPKSGYHQGAIETIGGMPIKDAAALTPYSGPAEMIRNMYLADVATMMFAVRMKSAGRDVAIDRICPMPQCNERCRTMKDLNDIEIKSLPDLTDKPLFKFTLADGANDGKGDIKNFYFEPLKFSDLGLFIGGNRVPDIEMLTAMISAIPESEVYGQKKGGNPFCHDLYRRMTQDDIDSAREAASQIQPGPGAAITAVVCACGQQEFSHQLNWARTPREFLYKSKKLLKEVE